MLVNSDTIIDVDIRAVLAQHQGMNALAMMVACARTPLAGSTPALKSMGKAKFAGCWVKDLLIHLCDRLCSRAYILWNRDFLTIPPDVNTCVNKYGYTKALSNNETLWSR
ncbi:MAG: hypothetical protein R3C68_03580 [Myxococcota bacterium]